ncbi:hypothetical protein BCV70DRAFT_168052 [Testicularia cyperi]|uniref:Rsm22-domain-containing protein n=1 Tax=Testicularia cyperi TaxID=1882483 RepID=A0A317XGB3_9BASI|nr:hypothetical protein BCV70DRAFT_168052 [Testicularia cyperi]
MKSVLRCRALSRVGGANPTASNEATSSSAQRHFASTSGNRNGRSNRAAALAKAAEASELVSERLAAGGPPLVGPSFSSHQANKTADALSRLSLEHASSTSHLNLSASQARRSRAALFGSSRITPFAASRSSQDPKARDEEEGEEDDILAYTAPTGLSSSSIYLPEYVSWAISQLITASDDPKLLRADHIKLAHLTDPQEQLAELAHIPPKRSSLLHLATASPSRYAAILSVLAEVRQRLANNQGDEEVLPSWSPDTVIDYDCAAGETLWAASKVFKDQETGQTTLSKYYGFDRRPNLLKSGKKVAESAATGASPAETRQASTRPAKTKEGGEEIEIDGVTYFEQEESAQAEEQEAFEEEMEEDEDAAAEPEFFQGPASDMSHVEKTFQSVPLSRDLVGAGGQDTMAVSAFALSLMTNDVNRFEAVQAMWDSNADVIVIIDQATPRGFASVASARAQLLQLGKSTPAGAHVVAPCSHDKPCPLLHPFSISSSVAAAVGARSDTGNPTKSKDVCRFTARFHTPAFLRRTKHSKRGEENVDYSYVVVRRGPRPSLVREAERRLATNAEADDPELLLESLQDEASQTKSGILDLLRSAKQASKQRRQLEEIDGRDVIEAPASQAPDGQAATAHKNVAPTDEMSDDAAMEELLKLLPDALQAEMAGAGRDGNSEQLSPEQLDALMASVRSSLSSSSSAGSLALEDNQLASLEADEDGVVSIPAPSAAAELAMRLESYSWPRLVKPPLKKGGHVTFDACCSSGNIERFTISKSSGRQAYQDARKSKWGDLFPHPPRSRSVVKVLNPLTALEYEQQDKIETGAADTADLESKLVLRAPSKLNSPAAAGLVRSNKQKGIEIIGLDEDEDADEVLRELFDDLPADTEAAVEFGSASSDVVSAASGSLEGAQYKLISPNLVTPTKKQTKRININYAKKWDNTGNTATAGTRNKLSRLNTNIATRQSPRPLQYDSDTADFEPHDNAAGFRSSLDPSPREKIRRSSRKKSRGDWDEELFGR